MRLTCPSCGARYEVDDSLLPPEGREVQCSNCTTTWFQSGREAGKLGSTPEAASLPPADPDPVPAADVQPAPPRPALDPALRDILAQEAAREVRLRRAEAGPVETQVEMPLAAVRPPQGRTRPRDPAEAAAATPPSVEPAAAPPAGNTATGAAVVSPRAPGSAPAPAARRQASPARDLFPDIDEINSTLRATGDRSGRDRDASDIDTLEAESRRRRARIGFFSVLAAALVGVALYAQADRVARAVPALSPAVAEYVHSVDSARFWLDGLAQDLAGAPPGG